MKKNVRLTDVANLAGISVKTASRVINGDNYVSDATRANVENAIEKLGYQPDLVARSLRKGVDDVLAIVVPFIGDVFFAEVIEEIEAVALARDVQIIIASNHNNPVREKQIVQQLQQRRVSGMVVVPNTADYSFLKHSGTPVVFLDREADGYATDTVKVDDQYGAQLAVEHLISSGHTRIAFFSDALNVKTSHDRYEGYRATLRKHGIAFDEELVFVNAITTQDAALASQGLLASPIPFTAIFSSRSVITMGVLQALHSQNRHDIALVSFGDFEMARVLEPQVTVIDHSPRVLGRLAADRIFEKIDKKTSASLILLGNLSLIRRGSGEIAPKEGRHVRIG
jgi:LacI family transcriptional regulator